MDALREVGANVKGMMAIFTYQLPAAEENFKAKQCPLHTLTNYETLLYKAIEEKYISEEDQQSLMEWRKDPQAWSDRVEN